MGYDMLTLIHWLFAIYIAVECFLCFYRMDRGDRFCRLAKYVVAVVVPFFGLGMCYLQQGLEFIAWWLMPDLAIALFLWPTTYARFTGGFKNRIGDK